MPSNGGYVDQRANDLRLTLVEGALDLGTFEVYDRQTCEIGGRPITAAVIGASHIVTFGADPALNEVFACVDMPQVSSWTLDRLVSDSVEREFPGFRYSFSAQYEPWTDPEPPGLTELVRQAQISGDSSSIGLVTEFPQGELPVSPKTVIVGYAEGGGIIIRTAHSYPQHRQLVLSQSVITTRT